MKLRQDHKSAILFLLPVVLGLLLFRLYPIVSAIIESLFTEVIGGGKRTRLYVGLENYLDLIADPVFRNSFRVTLLYNVITNPLQILLALCLALLLTAKGSKSRFFLSVYVIPVGMSLSVASVIWQIALNPEQGIVNSILMWIGMDAQPFFISDRQALWSIIFVTSWKGVSFWMIFIIAGIGEIPRSLYESAQIDGANYLRQAWSITIPLLRRVLLFVLVVDTSANWILFTPMYVITGGGPQQSTNVLMLEAFKSGFIYGDFGRSMAMVVVLLASLLVVIAVQFRLLGREE